MKFLAENALNELNAREAVLLATVHNKVVNEDLYVLLDENELGDDVPNKVRGFVKEHYASKFNDHELDVTYWKKLKSQSI